MNLKFQIPLWVITALSLAVLLVLPMKLAHLEHTPKLIELFELGRVAYETKSFAQNAALWTDHELSLAPKQVLLGILLFKFKHLWALQAGLFFLGIFGVFHAYSKIDSCKSNSDGIFAALIYGFLGVGILSEIDSYFLFCSLPFAFSFLIDKRYVRFFLLLIMLANVAQFYVFSFLLFASVALVARDVLGFALSCFGFFLTPRGMKGVEDLIFLFDNPETIGGERLFHSPEFHLLTSYLGVLLGYLLLVAIKPKEHPKIYFLALPSSILMSIFTSHGLVHGALLLSLAVAWAASEFKIAAPAKQKHFIWVAIIAFLVSTFNPAEAEKKNVFQSKEITMLSKHLKEQGEKVKILNDIEFSPYLKENNVLVFVSSAVEFFLSEDSRAGATGTRIADYNALFSTRTNYNEILNHWDFNYAILKYSSPIARVLIEVEGWEVVEKSEKLEVKRLGKVVDETIVLLKREKGKI